MEEIDLIKVLIDNVDVTDSLLIRDVDYVDYARGKVDLLEINLSNIDKDWEKWGLKIDQEIEVIYISDRVSTVPRLCLLMILRLLQEDLKS